MKRGNLMRPVLIAMILLLVALPARAGEADVLEVEAQNAKTGFGERQCQGQPDVAQPDHSDEGSTVLESVG